MSMGFSHADEEEDVALGHMVFFVTISLAFVSSIFWHLYAPDRRYDVSIFILTRSN